MDTAWQPRPAPPAAHQGPAAPIATEAEADDADAALPAVFVGGRGGSAPFKKRFSPGFLRHQRLTTVSPDGAGGGGAPMDLDDLDGGGGGGGGGGGRSAAPADPEELPPPRAEMVVSPFETHRCRAQRCRASVPVATVLASTSAPFVLGDGAGPAAPSPRGGRAFSAALPAAAAAAAPAPAAVPAAAAVAAPPQGPGRSSSSSSAPTPSPTKKARMISPIDRLLGAAEIIAQRDAKIDSPLTVPRTDAEDDMADDAGDVVADDAGEKGGTQQVQAAAPVPDDAEAASRCASPAWDQLQQLRLNHPSPGADAVPVPVPVPSRPPPPPLIMPQQQQQQQQQQRRHHPPPQIMPHHHHHHHHHPLMMPHPHPHPASRVFAYPYPHAAPLRGSYAPPPLHARVPRGRRDGPVEMTASPFAAPQPASASASSNPNPPFRAPPPQHHPLQPPQPQPHFVPIVPLVRSVASRRAGGPPEMAAPPPPPPPPSSSPVLASGAALAAPPGRPGTLRAATSDAAAASSNAGGGAGAGPVAPSATATSSTATSTSTATAAGAKLISSIQEDRALYQSILLFMAMSKDRPRGSGPSPRPPPSIPEGFYWKDYPALEDLLHASMAEYYALSVNRRQSKDQQLFNNRLVRQVRECASACGWAFHPVFSDDRRLRDRVRCFFKTHIANAKKRLNTMLKKPERSLAVLEGLVRDAAAASEDGGGEDAAEME